MTHLVADRMTSEQIECRGIRNPDVLRVIRSTPRHLFVPARVRSEAYEDYPLAIGHGATISQPYMVALMTELLAPERQHRVLEIGTGSGYQTAILAQLVAEVYSIEMVPELERSAAGRLCELGYANVTVRQGDGYKGWQEQAPFDGIMVTAAPHEVPAALIAQLARGGRLVVPVGSRWNQELLLIEKTESDTVRQREFGAVSFVPMEPAGEIDHTPGMLASHSGHVPASPTRDSTM
jgi:protein-L-isoaspartate(D-aspartate) O-methyltransferase